MAEEYYLLSRGLYFRPGAAGYTGIRDEAGLFEKKYAEDYCRPSNGEVKMVHKDDAKASEFMPAAYNDLVVKHLTKQRDDARENLALASTILLAAHDSIGAFEPLLPSPKLVDHAKWMQKKIREALKVMNV